jgi:hypothetical protein
MLFNSIIWDDYDIFWLIRNACHISSRKVDDSLEASLDVKKATCLERVEVGQNAVIMICWDLRLCVDPCLWCWSRYWNKRVSILYYYVDPYFPFISMLDPPEPLQRDRNCRCQALNQLELEQELTRSQQKVGKPHSWRQPKGSGLIWSHALHTSLLNFAGKRSRLSFPIFRTRLWSLSSSWLWKGNAAAIQSWLGRRIKCGSRFCTLVKDDCSRLVSFRSFRQDKVSSGIILAIWFALMCNHRESKSI